MVDRELIFTYYVCFDYDCAWLGTKQFLGFFDKLWQTSLFTIINPRSILELLVDISITAEQGISEDRNRTGFRLSNRRIKSTKQFKHQH